MQPPLELEKFILTHPKASDPFFISGNLRKPASNEYSIYSLDTLNELLKEMHANREVPELRYLVDLGGKLWFARERRIGGPASPAHYQMTGEISKNARCKAAGNIQFDANYKVVTLINHKSGDFRPSFISIQWLIAILLKTDKLPFTLPETLLIEELNSSNAPIKSHEWSTEILKKWTQTIDDPQMLELIANQPLETKKVSYVDAAPPLSQSPYRFFTNRCLSSLFDLDEPLSKLPKIA